MRQVIMKLKCIHHLLEAEQVFKLLAVILFEIL